MENKIGISISKIKEIEFSIGSTILPKEPFNIEFGVATEFNIEKETFDMNIVFDLKDAVADKIFVHIKVLNTFRIEKMKKIIAADNKTLNIPDNLIITMLSLSISHTRAMLAKNTSGTTFEDFYIPIVNPSEIAKEIFKNTQSVS